MLLTWATRDPAAALSKLGALLPTLKSSVLRHDLATHMAIAIANKDPRPVLDWLGGIPVEFRQASAIGAATWWAGKEPIAALDWYMANGIEVARGLNTQFRGFLPSVLETAMTSSPAATIAWLEALPVGADRERLLERAMSGTVLRHQKEFFEDKLAMRLFQQLPPEAQLRTAYDFGARNAEIVPLTDLNAWAQNFAPGPARAEAVAGAAAAVSRRNAARAESLVAGVGAGADRDAALRGVVAGMSEGVPAATRALEIGDSALRRETLDGVMARWRERDPVASRAWLQEASAIPAAWKQEWLQAR